MTDTLLGFIKESKDTPPATQTKRSSPVHPSPMRQDGEKTLVFASALQVRPHAETLSDLRVMLVAANAQLHSLEQARLQPKAVSGELVGTLLNPMGQPLPFVRITAKEVLTHSRPAATILASLGPQDKVHAAEKHTHSDRLGAFHMKLPVGEYQIHTGPSSNAAHSSTVHITEDSQATWRGTLDPGLILTGRVASHSPNVEEPILNEGPQAPPELMLVEAYAVSPSGIWIGVSVVQEDGTFFLPGCPMPQLQMDICRWLDSRVVHHEQSALTGQTDWSITPNAIQATSITFTPMDQAPGVPSARELRIWNADHTRGQLQKIGGFIGQPTMTFLPRGTWYMESLGDGAYPSEPQRVQVYSDHPMDLGPVPMSPSAWLQFPESSAGQDLTVFSETNGRVRYVAFHGIVPEAKNGKPYTIPVSPGTYRTMLRDSDTDVEPTHLGTLDLKPRQTVTIPQK